MTEHTLEGFSEPGLTELDWSFLYGTVSSTAGLSSPFPVLPHPEELATSSEVVMPDTTAYNTDMTTVTSEPVKSKRSARGKELDSAAKRGRAPNWRDDEKHALLMLKLEASVRGDLVTAGATWNVFVSNTLKERHGFDRAPKSCQQQSDTLKKQYDAIRLHDANAGAAGGMSYWKMKDQERDALKLPHRFYVGWSVLMESIMSNKKSSPIYLGPASDHVPTASPTSSSQVDDVHIVNPHYQTDVQPEQNLDFDMPLAMTNTTQQPPDMLSGDHELFLKVAPFVDKRIDDKIDDKIQPFMCGLLAREEAQQKHREKVLAMKMENLTLRRHRIDSIKMQCGAAGSVVADDVKSVQSDRS